MVKFLAQDLARWLVHMGGLANIIRRRGEIHTLHSSETILVLNFWSDSPFPPLPGNIALTKRAQD
jgi:hypothetical protein